MTERFPVHCILVTILSFHLLIEHKMGFPLELNAKPFIYKHLFITHTYIHCGLVFKVRVVFGICTTYNNTINIYKKIKCEYRSG